MKKLLFALILLSSFTIHAQPINYNITIANSADDAEQEGEIVDLNDLELDLGTSNGVASLIGLHFRDVFIVPGTSTDSATISLVLQQSFNSQLSIDIRLENASNPESYNDTIALKADRSFISQTVSWTINAGEKGDTITSPNLNLLLNEVLNRGDWGLSSGFNFILEPSSLGPDSVINKVQVYSYDQTQIGRRPRLTIATDSSNINGLNQLHETSSISIYPNPSSDFLFVDGLKYQCIVSIFNVNGVKVYESYINNNSIDIRELSVGFYTVCIEGSELKRNFKFLKTSN